MLENDFSMPNPNNKVAEEIIQKAMLYRNDLQRIMGTEATGRNFQIRAEGNSSLSIQLARNDGKSQDLRRLLAPGYKFIRSTDMTGTMGIDRQHMEIFVNPQVSSERGFVLSLLHEIGESYLPPPVLPEPRVSQIPTMLFLLGRLAAATVTQRVKEKITGNNTTTGKISQQLERVSLLPEWMYESYMSGRAKTERGAWAYALKQSRKLEKGGYNVLAGFENVADVKEYINCSLLSYELARLQTLMKKKGDAALENYQPRFIHQSPKKNVI
jgi:hypothetical protein